MIVNRATKVRSFATSKFNLCSLFKLKLYNKFTISFKFINYTINLISLINYIY